MRDDLANPLFHVEVEDFLPRIQGLGGNFLRSILWWSVCEILATVLKLPKNRLAGATMGLDYVPLELHR